MTMERYAAFDGAQHDLDKIDSDYVLVDEGVHGGWWYVTAKSFKTFMRATRAWDGCIAPYTPDGEETEFGKLVDCIELLTEGSAMRLGILDSFDPHADAWTFWYNDSIGEWQIAFLTEQQQTTITGGLRANRVVAIDISAEMTEWMETGQ